MSSKRSSVVNAEDPFDEVVRNEKGKLGANFKQDATETIKEFEDQSGPVELQAGTQNKSQSVKMNNLKLLEELRPIPQTASKDYNI